MVESVVEAYVPAAHSAHAVEAVVEANEPATHSTQTVDPEAEANEPAGHGTHVCKSSHIQPAEQGTQLPSIARTAPTTQEQAEAAGGLWE